MLKLYQHFYKQLLKVTWYSYIWENLKFEILQWVTMGILLKFCITSITKCDAS